MNVTDAQFQALLRYRAWDDDPDLSDHVPVGTVNTNTVVALLRRGLIEFVYHMDEDGSLTGNPGQVTGHVIGHRITRKGRAVLT